MAYNKELLFEQAKKLIVEHKLFFVDDIIAFMPCATSTFYEFFPAPSEKMEQLKRLLETNRTTLKVKLRKKWEDSESPALQMGLMKLLSNDDELKKLAMHYNVTNDNELSKNKKTTLDLFPKIDESKD